MYKIKNKKTKSRKTWGILVKTCTIFILQNFLLLVAYTVCQYYNRMFHFFVIPLVKSIVLPCTLSTVYVSDEYCGSELLLINHT